MLGTYVAIAGEVAVAKIELVKWLDFPEEHNFPAAHSYLSLILSPDTARDIIVQLKSASITQFKAKDIFRASALSLLGISNSHVKKDQRKIEHGITLSPLLLVRDLKYRRVIVADGYHRLCAVYSFDEDALIPCAIASYSDGTPA